MSSSEEDSPDSDFELTLNNEMPEEDDEDLSQEVLSTLGFTLNKQNLKT